MGLKREERQRYVKFHIFSRKKITTDRKELAHLLWRNFNYLFGEIKSGKAGFWIMDYDAEKQEGIIRCSHLVFEEMITTLTLINSINETRMSIDTIKSSGIMRKLPN